LEVEDVLKLESRNTQGGEKRSETLKPTVHHQQRGSFFRAKEQQIY
jgi:hypothetical protein